MICAGIIAGAPGAGAHSLPVRLVARRPRALIVVLHTIEELPASPGRTQKAGGGDGGIRTLDRALQPYNGLANRRLQPLGHVSVQADMPDAALRRKRQIKRRTGGFRIFLQLRVKAPQILSRFRTPVRLGGVRRRKLSKLGSCRKEIEALDAANSPARNQPGKTRLKLHGVSYSESASSTRSMFRDTFDTHFARADAHRSRGLSLAENSRTPRFGFDIGRHLRKGKPGQMPLWRRWSVKLTLSKFTNKNRALHRCKEGLRGICVTPRPKKRFGKTPQAVPLLCV